jgi:hypothetical protein
MRVLADGKAEDDQWHATLTFRRLELRPDFLCSLRATRGAAAATYASPLIGLPRATSDAG